MLDDDGAQKVNAKLNDELFISWKEIAMKNEVKPSWSKKEREAGERQRQAWEKFFSAAERANEIPTQPLPSLAEDQRIPAIQARHEAELLSYPNVVGVASGIRTKRGKPTGEQCLVVYVTQKIPRNKLGKGELLPAEIEGVPIDVVEIGEIRPLPVLSLPTGV